MLRAVLPAELVNHIDFATLALCPGSFVDEALKERYTDLLFSALIGERPALFYFLIEHQSTQDDLMGFRLLRYEVRIRRVPGAASGRAWRGRTGSDGIRC